nr:uncharacterized protein LOC106690576 [Halyomorpha halys]
MDSKEKNVSLMTSCQCSLADELNDSLEKFWEIETVPQVVKIDPQTVIAEEQFRTTRSRDANGRYILQLPFKDSIPPNLGNYYYPALNRFLKLEHRLNKSPELKESYRNISKEYLEANYVSPAIAPSRYLLPHHNVIKDNSHSKIRIVFDASFSAELSSLNDYLVIGPKLQLDIRYVLLNFH